MIMENMHVQDLQKALGLSKCGLNRKLKGQTEFKCDEIKKIIEILELDAVETMSIFFEE